MPSSVGEGAPAVGAAGGEGRQGLLAWLATPLVGASARALELSGNSFPDRQTIAGPGGRFPLSQAQETSL